MAEYRNKFTVDGLDDVAKDLADVADRFDGVADSGKKAGSAADGASRKLGGVSDEAKKAGRELGLNVNLLSEMTLGFGSLSPKLRESAVQFASVGNNVVTMGASFGPAGVALGVFVGALPSLISLLMDSGDAMEDLAIETDAATQSLLSQLDAIRRVREEQAQRSRIERGLAPVEDLERRVELARLSLVEAQRAADEASAFTRDARQTELRTAEAVLRRTMENLNAARQRQSVEAETARILQDAADQEERAKALREASSPRRERRSGGRRRRPQEDRDPQLLRFLEEAAGLVSERRSLMEEIITLNTQDLSQQEDKTGEIRKQLEIQRAMQAEAKEAAQLRMDETAAALAAQEKRAELEAQIAKRTDRTQGALEGVVSITAESFRLAKDGEKSRKQAFKESLDAWLASFAIEQALKGAAMVAEAIGSPPQAGIKLASAAKHFALAAVAGGASAAIPNGGGGGGGGPAPGPSSGGGGGGDGTIVINMNAPIAREEVGAMQARAERANRRRGGRR